LDLVHNELEFEVKVVDALPSHGVKPTWRFHKVKLWKVETW
jgi:hypothetical protein